MSQRDQELSGDDVAAFDSLIGHLEEHGRTSINLRECDGRRGGERWADPVARAFKYAIGGPYEKGFEAILSGIDLSVDRENVTLGRLNRDISLEQLIEIRRSLES